MCIRINNTFLIQCFFFVLTFYRLCITGKVPGHILMYTVYVLFFSEWVTLLKATRLRISGKV